MKIKVGMYVRTKDNEIDVVAYKGIRTDKTPYVAFNKIKLITNPKISNIKVSNTPQELIEVGDLIVHNEWENDDELELVRGILKDGSILLSGSVPVFLEYITEIWTRTNEDTYTRQWCKDER